MKSKAAHLLVLVAIHLQTAINTHRGVVRRVAVLNEAKSQNLLSPLEFWKQWNEVATRMWLNTTHSDQNKNIGTKPSDIYSSWVRTTDTIQERMTKNTQALLDPREAWKLWLDTTMDIWRGAANTGGDPLGMIAGWVKVMENVQERGHSGEALPIDPFILFNEWYNTISKPWSRMAEDIIASEQFLEFTGPFLESHSNLISAFRRASEAYFKTLRLPTLSDVAHVAELIVGLEEKIDHIEDAIERVKVQASSEAPTPAKTAELEQRLNQMESKLDRALALLEQIAARATGQQ
jgi:polyhydroxyalkanoic acid synthase PhaR subunit